MQRSTSDLIATRGGGYLLDVEENEVDAARFERLAEEGRRLLDAGRPKDADAALEEALGLWRGTAYQGFRYTGFGTSEGERLEELRRSAMEDRIYVQHYNRGRPHRGLELQVPESLTPVEQANGVPDIERRDLLGGLVHEHVRAA